MVWWGGKCFKMKIQVCCQKAAGTEKTVLHNILKGSQEFLKRKEKNPWQANKGPYKDEKRNKGHKNVTLISLFTKPCRVSTGFHSEHRVMPETKKKINSSINLRDKNIQVFAKATERQWTLSSEQSCWTENVLQQLDVSRTPHHTTMEPNIKTPDSPSCSEPLRTTNGLHK